MPESPLYQGLSLFLPFFVTPRKSTAQHLLSKPEMRCVRKCRFFTESWGIEQHLFHDPLDNEPLAA